MAWQEQLRTALGAGVAILLTGAIGHAYLGDQGTPWLAMSMGASAILMFGLPGSPLAQPWSFVGGHLVSAVIGITCARAIAAPWLACGIALGLAIGAMLMLRCLHPAGGAVTLITILGGDPVRRLGYDFLWMPLALNLALMLLLALLINNLLLGRPYPARRKPDNPHRSGDPAPLARTGLTAADIAASMRQFGVMVDVSQADLNTLFESAQTLAAQRRLGQIRCRDIMSTRIATVEFGTPLDEAWRLLYTHKVNALPVLDRYRHVIGIITLVDFLKAAQLNQPARLRERLLAFLQPNGKTHSDKAEVVGQIMTAHVLTVSDQMHIVALVGLLSDRGMHHVPIVDARDRLCGMVTQSDLIAALFEGVQH
ncbi:MAG: HPP family protein [Pseudomonadota bacterium]